MTEKIKTNFNYDKKISKKIPEDVLVNILTVFAIGTPKILKNLSDDIICDIHGNFSTTWNKVFEIRGRIIKYCRENNINTMLEDTKK